MELIAKESIELMQLAKAIASEESPPIFAIRHGLAVQLPESTDKSLPTRLEMTLHIYRQLFAELTSQ